MTIFLLCFHRAVIMREVTTREHDFHPWFGAITLVVDEWNRFDSNKNFIQMCRWFSRILKANVFSFYKDFSLILQHNQFDQQPMVDILLIS